jgi:hypothetical protein
MQCMKNSLLRQVEKKKINPPGGIDFVQSNMPWRGVINVFSVRVLKEQPKPGKEIN